MCTSRSLVYQFYFGYHDHYERHLTTSDNPLIRMPKKKYKKVTSRLALDKDTYQRNNLGPFHSIPWIAGIGFQLLTARRAHSTHTGILQPYTPNTARLGAA